MKAVKPIIHGRDHLSGGADPVLPGFPTGDTIDEKILAALPAGFWKLNESTGHVAADSSGHGQDLATTTPEVDPLWGFPAGPTGEQAADFTAGTDGTPGVATASRVSRAWPPISGDFTAGIWVNRTTGAGTQVMGQGNPGRAGGVGWELNVTATTGEVPAQTPRANLAGMPPLNALNPLPDGEWGFLALVYDHTATVCRLYVNGLLDATSPPFTFVPAGGGPLWVGHDGGLGGGSGVLPAYFAGSYAFFVNRALSGTELLDISAAAAAGTDTTTGLVLGIDDDGHVTWVQPKVEVTVNGEPADTTPEPPRPDPVPPPDGTGVDGDDWIEDQPFTWGGPEFEVPPNKWTTIPFTTPLMERHSNVTGGSTTWFELDWDDPASAGWVDPATPRVITIPHDMEFNPGNFQWFQICLKLEIPPVEDEVFVEGTTTRGSHRGLRVFETTHQKSLVEAYNWRTGSCDGHGALNVFRDPTKHPGLLGDAALFAFGDTGGEHDLEHGNIMLAPNSDYGYYLPGFDWLPGHASGNPILKKGMRLVPQVWHNAHQTLTFDCTGVLPYRPHFVMIVFADRGWGPPWSDWPTSD